jgi:Mn2+/Fe2+ NRAMP family transporter
VPIFSVKPIAVMVSSQAFGALLLPATVGCIFYIGNKSSLMGTYRFSTVTNIILSLIFVFAIVMSYMSFNGIMSTLQAL